MPFHHALYHDISKFLGQITNLRLVSMQVLQVIKSRITPIYKPSILCLNDVAVLP